MSAPIASCLPSAKAKEAVRYVIGMVLDFNPVDDCPLWLAMLMMQQTKAESIFTTNGYG
jgi:hypothetical protein